MWTTQSLIFIPFGYLFLDTELVVLVYHLESKVKSFSWKCFQRWINASIKLLIYVGCKVLHTDIEVFKNNSSDYAMEMSLYCVGGERISATYKGRRCRSNSGEHSCNNVTDSRIHRRWVEFYSQFCWRCNENDYCSYKVRVKYTCVCVWLIFLNLLS